MIVNIRGTHGSGKSTLVRKILDSSSEWDRVYVFDRKRPFGYLHNEGKLWVLGHYELEGGCGGCDTIPIVDDMFDSIKAQSAVGLNVLYEGILAQHGVPRVIELHKLYPTTVIILTTPEQECIDAVNARRAQKGKGPLDPPDSITGEFRSVLSAGKKLLAAGVDVRYHSREEALRVTKELLKWNY
jgi:thymidylate kinase